MTEVPTTERVREIQILERALAAFEDITGLRTRTRALEAQLARGRADAIVEVMHNDRPVEFVTEVKANTDRMAVLEAVKHQLAALDPARARLLVTPYMTPALADHCRRTLDLCFMDVAGNAFVRAPGLYIFTTGHKLKDGALPLAVTTRAGTAAALRVIFALLCRPDLLNAQYRDIVNAAGVALGAVGGILADLNQRRLIVGGTGGRQRRLLDAERLFEEWVTQFPIRLRPKLHPRHFQGERAGWWRHAQLDPGYAWWGGQVAADRLTKNLEPTHLTLYVAPHARQAVLQELAAAHKLRADPHGELEVLDTFWNFDPVQAPPDVVHPILVYADLIATLDPRNLEVAQQVRERYIDHVLRKA